MVRREKELAELQAKGFALPASSAAHADAATWTALPARDATAVLGDLDQLEDDLRAADGD